MSARPTWENYKKADIDLPAIRAAKQVMPIKKPKKRKNMKTQTATARADKYFSLLVRQRGRCEACNVPIDLQCAHGFSRRYRNVRWDFENAFCLCKACHMYYTHHPIEWDEWMRSHMREPAQRRGKVTIARMYYDAVRARALSTEKLVDVKERAAELEQLWKESQC